MIRLSRMNSSSPSSSAIGREKSAGNTTMPKSVLPEIFPDRNGNPYSSPWMQNKFKAFFAAANPGVDPDMLPPVRIYDLRHRFASAALSRWLDSGENLFNRLPYLRAYMGHKELSATVYYIHLLPENLVKSAGIEWDSLRRMIPEVELWDE